MIEGVIGSDGEVQSATILESSPPGVFDANALQAYKKWKYDPPEPGCPKLVKVRLDFKLDR